MDGVCRGAPSLVVLAGVSGWTFCPEKEQLSRRAAAADSVSRWTDQSAPIMELRKLSPRHRLETLAFIPQHRLLFFHPRSERLGDPQQRPSRPTTVSVSSPRFCHLVPTWIQNASLLTTHLASSTLAVVATASFRRPSRAFSAAHVASLDTSELR